MAVNMVELKVNDESVLSYNTFESNVETVDRPPASSETEKTKWRSKIWWLCSFSYCNKNEICKMFGCASEETVSDDIEFALVNYIQVQRELYSFMKYFDFDFL